MRDKYVSDIFLNNQIQIIIITFKTYFFVYQKYAEIMGWVQTDRPTHRP